MTLKIKSSTAVLLDAEHRCEDSGVKLTSRRRQVLNALLQEDRALSAYELMEVCNRESNEPMPAMSVYRILSFLEEQSLVHKLTTANKYVACSHITCAHKHYSRPQFLICNDCTRVQEVDISSEALVAMEQVAQTAGFHLESRQLELSGTCNDCRNSQ
ncbi:MAG: Fur family transcriptional regulator [Luminiphilus sp.]